MGTLYKVTDCEVKKVGERQYEFVASTATLDRDGEVIDVDGWDLSNFKKNPVIMWAHDYRNPPVGRATKIWKHDGKLKNTVEFPPEGDYEFADIVERLVDQGYLKTESVGFIPRKWEDGDGEKAPRRKYTKQELLEISIVPVPSNPDALRNAVDEGIITAKQLKAITEIKNEVNGINNDTTDKAEEVTKPEETDDFIRIPNPKDDKTHEGHKIRTIQIDTGQGITALYCVDCKIIVTYLFDKAKGWTMAKAKKWVADHSKNVLILEIESDNHIDSYTVDELAKEAEIELDKPVSQEEIKDEIDYLKDCINDVGLSDDTKPIALELIEVIQRFTGNDIPDDIEKGDDGDWRPTKEIISKMVSDSIREQISKLLGKVD
jgi:HK97 family phage prohead protease